MNQSNKCCLYSLESRDLVCRKLLSTTYDLHYYLTQKSAMFCNCFNKNKFLSD